MAAAENFRLWPVPGKKTVCREDRGSGDNKRPYGERHRPYGERHGIRPSLYGVRDSQICSAQRIPSAAAERMPPA